MTTSDAEGIHCGGFTFYNNFDSANLARVEQVVLPETPQNVASQQVATSAKSCCGGNKSVPSPLTDETSPPEYEFNLWTKHDCHGTEYQNNNRTWFYFGVVADGNNGNGNALVKFNIINLNKQMKMFSQGMCPVYKVVPGQPRWERIRDKPNFCIRRSTKDDEEKGVELKLSFTHLISNTVNNSQQKTVTYFAFTYPFTYTDLQKLLKKVDTKMAAQQVGNDKDSMIYYHRECAIHSLEGRRLDLLTISSFHGISEEREDKLVEGGMFPESNVERPFKFKDKKVVFLSARVHPGETPSSFVLNGFFNFLLERDDPTARSLRRLYVFKLVPMLNPDGVARGHYRMDTRGVNLNRVYLNPSPRQHPTIYAARTLIRYYHHRYSLPPETDSIEDTLDRENTAASPQQKDAAANKLLRQVTLMSLDESGENLTTRTEDDVATNKVGDDREKVNTKGGEVEEGILRKRDSGIFLYVDMHGHASKKGIFMYGNHFDNPEESIACMMLPKLMSINNANFHFTSCNFTEKNMYLIDKRDGMSREGSGRVAVYKMTGLVRSYTLECNYNSGRLVNSVPPRVGDPMTQSSLLLLPPTNTTTTGEVFVPPKYTPAIYQEVGAALGASILDVSGQNPKSRVPGSQYRCLKGLQNYLKLTYVNSLTESLNNKRLLRKDKSDAGAGLGRGKLVDAPSCSSRQKQQMSPRNGRNSSPPPPKKQCMAPRSGPCSPASAAVMMMMMKKKKKRVGATCKRKKCGPAVAGLLPPMARKPPKALVVDSPSTSEGATSAAAATVAPPRQVSKRLKASSSPSSPSSAGRCAARKTRSTSSGSSSKSQDAKSPVKRNAALLLLLQQPKPRPNKARGNL